jgi:hypothetical protein
MTAQKKTLSDFTSQVGIPTQQREATVRERERRQAQQQHARFIEDWRRHFSENAPAPDWTPTELEAFMRRSGFTVATLAEALGVRPDDVRRALANGKAGLLTDAPLRRVSTVARNKTQPEGM